MYASADATPLFLTQMQDYVRASGDVDFIRRNRKSIESAWQFETTHDSDGDGIYDNSQGSGWVESWPPVLPHQEIYLALLDQQASAAMSELANLFDDKATAAAALTRAQELTKKIEAEYYMPASQTYAFSWNKGVQDRTATIYPSIAWWNPGAGLSHTEPTFEHWNSHDFSTDWGLRDVSENDPVFDPISYHQGSVWPLFTGWVSLAEYRTGHALSGYAHLMQNADQTTTQDLGAVTELLSGTYFQPFCRSTSHQLWSSCMVITPALHGLFGIDLAAMSKTVSLNPHLPADWDRAEVRHIHVGSSVIDLSYRRTGQHLVVRIAPVSGEAVRLKVNAQGATVAPDGQSATFQLPAIEVALPRHLPLPGARTAQPKVLMEETEARSLHLELEAQGGSTVEFRLRRNADTRNLVAEGATIAPQETNGAGNGLGRLIVKLPPSDGYQQKTVTLRW